MGSGISAEDQPSAIGMGCMGITAFYGAPMKQDDATALLQHAYEGGCRHFDTAEIYKSKNPFKDDDGGVYNEAVLAPFLATVPRDSVTVATKFMPFKYGGQCDYATVKGALERSLKRLGLAAVDVYYCHRIPSLPDALEFVAACKRLAGEGLLRHVGLSEICGAWLRRCHAVHPIAAVQQEWSLLTRNLEAELVPVCAELNVGIVAYSPLARNLLCPAGPKPEDWRATNPRYAEGNWAKNVALAERVAEIAEAKGATAAQLSLAWLLHKAAALGVRVVPIPGTTKRAHSTANLAAAALTVTDEEMSALEALGATVAGARGGEDYVARAIEGQDLLEAAAAATTPTVAAAAL